MGTRVKRVEDARLLTAGGTYIDDVEADDAAHVVFVRATVAHASFCVTDRAAALAAPGVLGVHLFEDLALEPAGDPDISAMFALPIVRPWLARDVVRFIGEPIAAVVATTRAAAVDAAELVAVDYEPLPTVVDVEAAMRADAPVLFAGTGTNVVVSAGSWDDDPEFFADCEVVVRERIVNSRVAAAPLETRGAISRWRDGRLEHSTPTQRPHGVRDTLAGYLGLAPQAVRLRTPDVGGGFGVKIGVAREEVVVAQLARLTGRCLRWYETRSESLQAMGHGRAQVQYAELGGTRDGHFVAYRLRVVQEAGAYPDVGAILPIYTGLMAPGVYGIERVAFASRSVLSNTAPTVAFRGAGRPEATAALERMVDVYATAIGMDPAALRRRNVIGRDAFPFTTPTGAVYDSGDYEGAIDKALDAAG
ncbi:MAG: molybdopterin-dependent oxidoreductase, partial [Actinobacteria bacterium]|nr:molybdopterin-dependent oxidoreductase [Actinomycetota bacterium]